MYPQNITVRLKFSVYDNIVCKLWSHIAITANTTYITIKKKPKQRNKVKYP